MPFAGLASTARSFLFQPTGAECRYKLGSFGPLVNGPSLLPRGFAPLGVFSFADASRPPPPAGDDRRRFVFSPPNPRADINKSPSSGRWRGLPCSPERRPLSGLFRFRFDQLFFGASRPTHPGKHFPHQRHGVNIDGWGVWSIEAPAGGPIRSMNPCCSPRRSVPRPEQTAILLGAFSFSHGAGFECGRQVVSSGEKGFGFAGSRCDQL
jgi:hypothetical protein